MSYTYRMNRLIAAFIALLMTGLVILAAFKGVSWLMTSPTVWAIARQPWFKPSMIAFNLIWPSVWLPFYLYYANRKKPAEPETRRFR